ncbi:MAG: PfkB family carbohydrate kinase [Actinomycetota bacterium]
MRRVGRVDERPGPGQQPRVAGDLPFGDGDRLLDAEAERAYLDRLLPAATVLTPNLREAAVLVGRPLTTVADMTEAAAELAGRGPAHVVVKGGHLDGDAVDVHHDREAGTIHELGGVRIASPNVHGTGCSFAAAITALIARGADPPAAIRAAKDHVHTAIAGAARWRLGAGQGPIDPLGWGDAEPAPLDPDPATTEQEQP